ncbi:transcriptional regulator, partial [Bacillus velezensis]
YETKCKLLEKAEAYDLKNLALLENEKWQYLNKEDLLMLDHYFSFISDEAKKRSADD